MPSLDELTWSDDVTRAEWIGDRLAPADSRAATSVVPSGFEAYARIFHPAEEPRRGRGRLVRWHDVAAWSGLVLDPYAEFFSIALPPDPIDTPPWSGQGPRHGSLYPPDALVLTELVRVHTTTPEQCWFCLWDGYGWQRARCTDDGASPVVGSPIPGAVQAGPRVRLPHRDYFLYRGAMDAALVGYPGEPPDQTGNLWWPEDRAWCVASEIDLSWTYVGGSSALVHALMSEPAIEALQVSPGRPVGRTEPWIERWVSDALGTLFSSGQEHGQGHALVSTPMGSVEAWLDLPRGRGRGAFRTHSRSVLGHEGRSGHVIHRNDRHDAATRDEVRHYLQWALIELVGS